MLFSERALQSVFKDTPFVQVTESGDRQQKDVHLTFSFLLALHIFVEVLEKVVES